MTEIVNDRVSIQVGLSGYSFKIQAGNDGRSSGWMSAERIFTTPELQKRYGEVEISGDCFTKITTNTVKLIVRIRKELNSRMPTKRHISLDTLFISLSSCY